MIAGSLVVDAVVHGFDADPSNLTGSFTPGGLHREAHEGLSPSAPRYASYILPAERWERTWKGDELGSCLFAESQTDIAVYHVIRQRLGYTSRGEWSPMHVGLELRQWAGAGRVLIFGGLTDPFDTRRSIDEIDQMIDEYGIIGLKFYPHVLDSRAGEVREFYLDDEDVAFPLLEHLRTRGIKAVGIHKAMGSVLRAFGVADLDGALAAFPDLQFEIVHAGWAFLEDVAILAARPNVYLNLEATASLLGRAPRRFAEVIGRFLSHGGSAPDAQDRILWGTGAMSMHPQPLLELFWDFQIPEDMREGYGYPEVTDEIKRKILGENYARKLGLTPPELLSKVPHDEMRRAQLAGDLAAPWSRVPDGSAVAGAVAG